jgi:ketopantoate hydroxymethyltransferase
MTAMLASPIHRTVLLFGRWRTIGIGARASCDGQTIYALDFLG